MTGPRGKLRCGAGPGGRGLLARFVHVRSVPELDGVVAAPGGKRPSVRRNRDRQHGIGVASQCAAAGRSQSPRAINFRRIQTQKRRTVIGAMPDDGKAVRYPIFRGFICPRVRAGDGRVRPDDGFQSFQKCWRVARGLWRPKYRAAAPPRAAVALEDLGGEPGFGAGQAKTAVQILGKLPPAGLGINHRDNSRRRAQS
jgi:hypothetical protein